MNTRFQLWWIEAQFLVIEGKELSRTGLHRPQVDYFTSRRKVMNGFIMHRRQTPWIGYLWLKQVNKKNWMIWCLFQNRMHRNAGWLFDFMAECVGRVNHRADTLYLTTLVWDMPKKCTHQRFLNAYIFIPRPIVTCSKPNTFICK